MHEISRRTFLSGVGLGALAWACGGSEPRATSTPTPAAVSLFATAPEGLAVGDSRQGFAILEGAARPLSPAVVSVRLTPPGGEEIDPIEATKTQIRFGVGGSEEHEHETEVQEIYVVRRELDVAGVWQAEARFDGRTARTVFSVAPDAASPRVGQKAKRVASPTTDDALGVDPICTRMPPCSMHNVTIADALARSKPLVITFGTPAHCTSRTCGPVVDHVEAAKGELGDAGTFIHVEVWKDNASAFQEGGEVAAFREWGFATEPWTYFIGADGVVRDRWQGAVGAGEVLDAAQALTAGEL